jgi:hypothetical protein
MSTPISYNVTRGGRATKWHRKASASPWFATTYSRVPVISGPVGGSDETSFRSFLGSGRGFPPECLGAGLRATWRRWRLARWRWWLAWWRWWLAWWRWWLAWWRRLARRRLARWLGPRSRMGLAWWPRLVGSPRRRWRAVLPVLLPLLCPGCDCSHSLSPRRASG